MENEDKITGFAVLGLLVGVPAMLVINAIVNGLVLRTLWGWFIVPVFHCPALTIASALGLGYTVSYLTQPIPDKKTKVDWGVYSTGMILKPVLALLFGWIVQRFM